MATRIASLRAPRTADLFEPHDGVHGIFDGPPERAETAELLTKAN
jgi:hypothetical protein